MTILGQGTAYTITWPGAVKWPSGIAPTITTTLNKRDIFGFVSYDGGTTIYANIVAQNL
jgi:phosphoenolpyruvate-protein kinase (PTS system EI component)